MVKDFGAVGPSHPNGAWSRYVMGVDDTHAYIASGMIPAWYLVAVNLQTGEQKVLLESPTERVMDIIERFPGAYARVPKEGGAPDKEYLALSRAGDSHDQQHAAVAQARLRPGTRPCPSRRSISTRLTRMPKATRCCGIGRARTRIVTKAGSRCR